MNIRLVYAKIASAPQRVFTPNFTLEITPTSFKIKNKEDLRGSTFENGSEADARRFTIGSTLRMSRPSRVWAFGS